MKISIITPTIRERGLELVYKALKYQIFKDWEWLIGSPFDPKIKEAKWVKDDFKGGFWTLNRIYNRLIKEAKGELLVSWQDYTWAKPDALQKFWFHYQNNKKAVVSGVGNKYSDESWTNMVWKDPRQREDFGSFYETTFDNCEGNFCAVPKEAVLAVGCFIPEFDFAGFGMDWYSVFERLDEVGGWQFFLDQTNKSFSLPHPRNPNWDKYNLLGEKYEQLKERLRKEGKWPVYPLTNL